MTPAHIAYLCSYCCGTTLNLDVTFGHPVPNCYDLATPRTTLTLPCKGGEKIRKQKLEACLLGATKTEVGVPARRTVAAAIRRTQVVRAVAERPAAKHTIAARFGAGGIG